MLAIKIIGTVVLSAFLLEGLHFGNWLLNYPSDLAVLFGVLVFVSTIGLLGVSLYHLWRDTCINLLDKLLERD